MPESLKTRLMRWRFNFFPAYRGTGARITYIADDWREVRIKLPLNWRTRNYVGTIYGGSMYAAVDPFHMVMLIRVLGPDYVVWDKSAAIQFKRPGSSTLYATFVLDDQGIETIKAELTRKPAVDRVYHVDLTDQDGVVYASVEKTIYIRRKEAKQNASGRA
jgi:acyl-coenzyme A thioesterase PaaI-like protein